VNNGQPVTGSLTLGAFDAIILLADHIDAPRPPAARPTIKSNGVISAGAFGAFSSIAPGSWIEIYGSNLAARHAPGTAPISTGTALHIARWGERSGRRSSGLHLLR